MLNELDAQMLTFEHQWWKYPGAKESAVRDQFGISMTRYYQVLNRIIDEPAALAADPLLVKRLRRQRVERRRQRDRASYGLDS